MGVSELRRGAKRRAEEALLVLALDSPQPSLRSSSDLTFTRSEWLDTTSENTASLGRKRMAPEEDVTGGITYFDDTSLMCLVRWVCDERSGEQSDE